MTPMHRLPFVAPLLLAALVSSAARTQERGGAAALPGDPNAGTAEPVRRRMAMFDAGLDAGWESEERASEASARLGVVRDALEGKAGAEALATVLAPGFRVLRPAVRWEVALDSGGLRVERGGLAEDPERAAGDAAETPDAALELLAGWAGRGGELHHPHAKLKVVAITPVGGEGSGTDAPRYDTTVRVELAGELDGRAVYRVAAWRLVWEHDDAGLRIRELVLEPGEVVLGPAGGGELFRECTASMFAGAPAYEAQLVPGIDAWRARLDASLVLPLLGHPAGIAVADVDGDGREDLYLCQPGGLPNRLFLHRPDGTVEDASARSGADFLEFSRSALLIDLDGDGDRDLAVVLGGELQLSANDGTGRFEPRLALAAPETTSLAAADPDADGDLDLYACAYLSPYGGEQFPVPYHDAENGPPNRYFRNEGDWRFADATADVGLDDNNTRFSFAASWEDYDDDGDADLYVANDFGRNNLYRNDDGRFTDVAAEAGVEDVSAGMAVSWGDYDGDGRMDLHVGNMFSSAGNRTAYQRRFQAGAADAVRALYRRHARGNSLFRNRGDGTFEDVSLEAGITMGRWAWGSTFVDWNADGREDLLVPNGFLTLERQDDL